MPDYLIAFIDDFSHLPEEQESFSGIFGALQPFHHCIELQL